MLYIKKLISEKVFLRLNGYSISFGKDAKNAYHEIRLLKGVYSKSFKESDDSVFHFEDKLGNKFDYNTGKKL